jgi:predicted nucleotidyltransferase
MRLDKNLKNQIIERLKTLNPEKVILFGSYAYGQPRLDSDIDLIVVLKDNIMPASFKENMQIYLKVSSAIRELKRKFPIDLIVYTKPMYEKMVELKSSFLKDVLSRGINLL